MKKSMMLLGVIALAMLLFGGGPPGRQTWEYGLLLMNAGHTEFLDASDKPLGWKDPIGEESDPIRALNIVGSRGWEMVAFERLGAAHPEQQQRWWFRRPK